ncbi:hypothetical protein [Agaribacter flavus]|uniref:Transposase n=1 Tax=Agaribacter flavus TaxID=1902781 RepID=A0ABV7FQI1_9ALTE
MQRFYSTVTELNFFTLSSNSLLFNQPCPHCQCADQWVSHGFNYSQSGEVRGKRIVCCARFGKQGCGKTIALYLASMLPKRRYALDTLFRFICALIQGKTVERAYYHALKHPHYSQRQAYRWLNALYKKIGTFRTQFGRQTEYENKAQYRSKRLSTLLPTLKQCVTRWPELRGYHTTFNDAFC